MSDWDREDNSPEPAPDPWAAYAAGASDGTGPFNDTLNLNPYAYAGPSGPSLRIDAEETFNCTRHGRVQSFTLATEGRDGTPQREVKCCMQCFMDLMVRHCECTDTGPPRDRHEERMRMMEMQYRGSPGG